MSKLVDGKSSRLEVDSSAQDAEAEVYNSVIKFAWKLAWQSEGKDVLMEVEEIVSELMVEVAKGLKDYKDFPPDRLHAALTQMLKFRASELRFRFYGTSRRIAKLSISIESDEVAENITSDEEPGPEAALVSKERVEATRSLLTSDTDREVFDAVIYGNGRLDTVMGLASMRASSVYKNPSVNMKPRHVADALCLTTDAVTTAFRHIREAYLEVCNGYSD